MAYVGEAAGIVERGWATRYGHRARLARAWGREAARGRSTFARSVNRGSRCHLREGGEKAAKRSGKTSLRICTGREEKAWGTSGAAALLAELTGDEPHITAAPLPAIAAASPPPAAPAAPPPLLRQRSAPSTRTEVAAAERRAAAAAVPLRAWAPRALAAAARRGRGRRPPTRWEVAARSAEDRAKSITLPARWARLAARSLDGVAARTSVGAAPAAATAALARVLRGVLARPLWERQRGTEAAHDLRSLACRLAALSAQSTAAARAPTPEAYVPQFPCPGGPLHKSQHAAVAAFGACAESWLARRPATTPGGLRLRLRGHLPAPPKLLQQGPRLTVAKSAPSAAEAAFGVPVGRHTQEYKAVVDYFAHTLAWSGSVGVVSLARLHNPEVCGRYAKTAPAGETVMFHGCRTLANEDSIIRNGFDVACCRSGGGNYGTWLAYAASYSNGGFVYTEHSSGVRHIFVCMVSYHHVLKDDTTMRVVGQDCAYPMWLLKYQTLSAPPTTQARGPLRKRRK